LLEPARAITACTYVVAGSAAVTIDRVKSRIVGTMMGVPIGLAFLPPCVDAAVPAARATGPGQAEAQIRHPQGGWRDDP
jgi:hypothetical protein